MATWNSENVLLTLTGREVLSKVQAGIGSITVSRIVSGGGFVSPSQLYTQTKVTNEMQEMEITDKVTSSGGSNIEVQVSNEKLETEYDLYQIGIYVTHPDYEGEVLYLIAQCDIENPDHIPLPLETPVSMSYSLYMTHSGTAEVTIEISPTGTVSKKTFELFKQIVNTHMGDLAIHTTLEEKEIFKDKYTKSEIDGKLLLKANTDLSNVDEEVLKKVIANSGAGSVSLIASGTGKNYTANAEGISLRDGLSATVKLHADMKEGATLNLNNSGNIPIIDAQGKPTKGGMKAGNYITLIYNGSNWVLQSCGGCAGEFSQCIIYNIMTDRGNTVLDGSTLTVNDVTYELSGEKAEVKIDIEEGVTYNAVLSDKEDYATPKIPDYKADMTVPIKILVCKYTLNRAYVDVNVTSADGASPTGVKVSVGEQTKTFEGVNPIRFKVKANTQYAVKVSDWVGGTTPKSLNVTTGDAESTTKVEMKYTQTKPFSRCTPQEIQRVSNEEKWTEWGWKVGDRHEIKLTGNVNGVNLTGTWYVMIIGFNHNWQKEGKGITLQFVNNSLTGGNNLAFKSFKMNNTDINTGGWKNSLMRIKTCADFFNALPKEWQDIIKTTTKYTDNQGGGNDNNPITATEDKIFLLAEKEVHGKRTYANSHEQSYQLQYDYYKAGNTKVRYQHISTDSIINWWLRSPIYNNSGIFCIVNLNGFPDRDNASFSIGFSPAFRV